MREDLGIYLKKNIGTYNGIKHMGIALMGYEAVSICKYSDGPELTLVTNFPACEGIFMATLKFERGFRVAALKRIVESGIIDIKIIGLGKKVKGIKASEAESYITIKVCVN